MRAQNIGASENFIMSKLRIIRIAVTISEIIWWVVITRWSRFT